MQKVIEENKDLRINDYIDFRHKFQAQIAKAEKEKSKLDQMFNNFVKNNEAADRVVFIKQPDFYQDCLNKSDFKKVMADIDSKIKALKIESEESTKIELDRIKTFQGFMSSPNEHLKSLQETSDKLIQAAEA